MKRAGPIGTIVCAVAAIITLGLGAQITRWVMFTWPAIVIIWSLMVLSEWRTNRLNRTTINFQARVIRSQGELLARIATEKNGGRE